MAALHRTISTADQDAVPVARSRLPTARAILPYLERIDETRRYSNFGPLNGELESRLAARLGAEAQVCTLANGTLAITLALQAAGARPGTLCAMPAWTFAASAHAAVQAGLTPWFLDVDSDTWMLDIEATRAALWLAPGPVGAVMPVAAFGRMPDLAGWRAFADDTQIPVVVDGAAAFDALDDAPVPVTVSLHATKTLGAGEGGYVASRDAGFIRSLRERTNFGFAAGQRVSATPGTNAKLSEYAAAVALAGLDEWPAARARLAFTAQRLRAALALTGGIGFQSGWGSRWVSSVCVVRTPDGAAAAIAEALAAAGIETRAWWGAGCHAQPAFSGAPRADLAVTEALAASTLGLPFYVDMDDEAQNRLAMALTTALEGL